MRIRYENTPQGKLVRKAAVYTQQEHRIPPEGIDPDAVRIIRRLQRAGHTAYIVGGAVRDLLIGCRPKDFDIATDARPRRIRKLFANSRIIGRRFRIVHIFFPSSADGPSRNGGFQPDQKIFEVTTFRGDPEGETEEEVYGTIEEDVRRRDFTVNALFYDPVERVVIDYVGGLQDVRARRLRTLAPIRESFTEDPVRMIRAVRYAGQTGFRLSLNQNRIIRQHRRELLNCSMERVTEDLYKILKSGHSAAVMTLAYRLKLAEVLLPALDEFLDAGRAQGRQLSDLWRLEELDERQRAEPDGEIDRGVMLAYLLWELFKEWSGGIRVEDERLEDPLTTALQLLRAVGAPLKPSNRELRVAAALMMGLAEEQATAQNVRPATARGPRTEEENGRRRRRRRPPRSPARGRQEPSADGRAVEGQPSDAETSGPPVATPPEARD